MAIYNKNNKLKIMCGSNKIKKGYYMGNKIYSSGSVVTYYVDSASVYSEEFDEGENVLSPRGFTPSKSGDYQFAGWRTDKVPSADVLSGMVMADIPITLYAVFKQTITLSYNGNGNTEGSVAAQTKTLYYNNGNYAYPAFTLAENGFSKNEHIFCGWTMGSPAGTRYASGASVTLSSNTTFYAEWYRLVIPFEYTGGIQTFTVPYNGTYQLEVWGAQGGHAQEVVGFNWPGGLGGYAKGQVHLTQGTTLYVVVGGEGGSNFDRTNPGGYNGGGDGEALCGGGGGATHIGTFNSTLAEHKEVFELYKENSGLYIVAGGGGGGGSSYADASDWQNETGGIGGGNEGGLAANYANGSSSDYGKAWPPAGQSSAYVYEDNEGDSVSVEFTFGKGHNAGDHDGVGGTGCGGGGGGLYGGKSALAWGDDDNWLNHAGAGGSGYIGGVEYGEWGNESDLRSGNGAAKITLLSLS